MLFQGFIHSALLWGTLLAAVPLLIHLFNRQRHKPMQWAAMKFVLAAYKRTRRRAQLENLLLLLFRMLAVALLALAIARPFTGTDSPLTALTESRRDLALIVDVSASTGYRESIQSVQEAILERATQLLEDRDGERGDRVRLYTAGSHPRLVAARSPEDARVLLESLEGPTAETLDLARALGEVADYAETEAAGTGQSSIEVRLLTDLQRRNFEVRFSSTEAGTETGDAALEPLTQALDRLEALGLRVWVEDLGASANTPPNLGIESIGPLEIVLGAGLTTEIAVQVKNYGAKSRPLVRVALEVDGVRQQVKKLDVPARASAEAIFQVVFSKPGPHTVQASLEGDRLQIDDRRATVVLVPAPMRVLLVDGDPFPEIDRDEVGYLRAVLEPYSDDLDGTRSSYSAFRTTVVTAIQFGFGELDLDEFDLIVLANVGSLSERSVHDLENRVGAGGALFMALGDKTADRGAIESLNSRMWRADGTGLLPARLFRLVSAQEDAYYRCSNFDGEHPGLAFFADERWRPFLTEVPIYSFVACEEYEPDAAIASLDDDGHHPLLLEREFGRGRVMLWTSSIDAGWNRVPESPSTFIPLIHELFRHVTRGQPAPRNMQVGDAFTLETQEFPRAIRVKPPGRTEKPLDGEPSQVVEGIWRLPPVGPLDATGLWSVAWEGGSEPFSVEIDPGEGDLDRLSVRELENHHSVWRIADADAAESAGDSPSDKGELWRWFAALALLMLTSETLWSAWLEHKRRIA